MANTSPDNIYYPVSTDQINPLATRFAALANSVQNALNAHPYTVADHAALKALVGMTTGSLAVVVEGGAIFEYNGTAWIQKTEGHFTSAAARSTAYAKASSAYLVPGATSYISGSEVMYTYGNGQWRAPLSNVVSQATVLVGSVPPVGTQLIRQTKVATVSSNSSGDASIAYDSAFPNGVLSVQLQRRDYSSLGMTIEILASSQSLTQANFRIYGSNGSPVGAASGFSYAMEVVGW